MKMIIIIDTMEILYDVPVQWCTLEILQSLMWFVYTIMTGMTGYHITNIHDH